MIPPRKVKFEAKKRENENLRFRTFLKCNADEDELDRQFADLHKELFEKYDCSRCRNCCKEYYAEFMPKEIGDAARYIDMEMDSFIQTYLKRDDVEEKYLTKQRPCLFLQKNGLCLLGECKPVNCKEFPYTNQPERLYSLYGVLDVITVCPVAFEIWEQLKRIYNFR